MEINLNGKEFVMDSSHLDEDYKESYIADLMSVVRNSSEFSENAVNEIFKKRRIKVVDPISKAEFTDWDKIPDVFGKQAVTAMFDLSIEAVEDEDDAFAEWTKETTTYKLHSELTKETWYLTLQNRTNALQAKYDGVKIDHGKAESNKWLRGQIEKLIENRISFFTEVCKENQGYTSFKEIPVQHILRVLGEHFFVERRKN